MGGFQPPTPKRYTAEMDAEYGGKIHLHVFTTRVIIETETTDSDTMRHKLLVLSAPQTRGFMRLLAAAAVMAETYVPPPDRIV